MHKSLMYFGILLVFWYFSILLVFRSFILKILKFCSQVEGARKPLLAAEKRHDPRRSLCIDRLDFAAGDLALRRRELPRGVAGARS